ncbi:MAG TPA: hypothetical protein VNI82_00590 [Candidatus Nitrosotenuis sp.]|nr:hypothetical protein [Candidatus Nitrosotenuis sp.]
MDSPESEANDASSQTAPNNPRRTPNRFKLPVDKIGTAAIKAVSGTKEFLAKDVKMPSQKSLIGDVGTITKPAFRSARAIAELKSIVKRSREVLISASTVFPPRLFQDSIIVDRTKVTIIKRTFIWSAEVISIRVEDILNVSTSIGPVFGSINISSRVMNSTDHFQVGSFWRSTVIDVKHIIQGYIIARNNNIDTDHLSIQELISTLEELGQDSGSL